jgi:hypothetical protein
MSNTSACISIYRYHRVSVMIVVWIGKDGELIRCRFFKISFVGIEINVWGKPCNPRFRVVCPVRVFVNVSCQWMCFGSKINLWGLYCFAVPPVRRCLRLPFDARILFFNFNTSVYEMWIIQVPNKVAVWNKRHFEEKRTENMQHI